MRKIITGVGKDDFINLSSLHLTVLPDLSDVKIYGDFYCSENYLIDLTGAPLTVRGNFVCSRSNLTSLSGAPHEVGGKFFCSDNNLINLIGAPHIVGDSFFCHLNNLTSLKGIPKKIGGSFVLSHTLKSRFSIEYVNSLSEILGSVTYL